VAVFSLKAVFISQMGQGTQIIPDSEYYIPSPAAVTAGGSSLGYIFFPAKSNTAVSPGTGGNLYNGFIGKFFHD
jgi:hypothetical protein